MPARKSYSGGTGSVETQGRAAAVVLDDRATPSAAPSVSASGFSWVATRACRAFRRSLRADFAGHGVEPRPEVDAHRAGLARAGRRRRHLAGLPRQLAARAAGGIAWRGTGRGQRFLGRGLSPRWSRRPPRARRAAAGRACRAGAVSSSRSWSSGMRRSRIREPSSRRTNGMRVLERPQRQLALSRLADDADPDRARC